ncbi:MAG: hypothetical protein H7839_09025 [Magnetococcus sp. YQC-5]
MQQNISTLDDGDWEALFPGEELVIGNKTFYLRPLGLDGYSRVVQLVTTSIQQAKESRVLEKMQGESLSVDEALVIGQLVVKLLSENIPEVIEICLGLNRADAARLPPGVVTGIVERIIDINAKSQEGFVKNLVALIQKVATQVQGIMA